MPTTQRKTILLDFEKPLVELEDRISQIRDLAEDNDVDVSTQLQQLQTRADHLRHLYGVVACEEALDLGGSYVLAADLEHVLGAAVKHDRAVVVE